MQKIQPSLDKKKTIKEMKQKLKYLSYYSANLRLKSILYGEMEQSLCVEDEVSDYLHYTKSVINIQKKKTPFHDEVLVAMHKQELHKQRVLEKDLQAYVLLEGIAQLPKKERELLFDVYVRNYDRHVIMQKMGGVVESTYHRRLHKALLHLAMVLHMELYKEYDKDVRY